MKKFLAILLSGMMILSLAACGGSNAPAASTSTNTTPADNDDAAVETIELVVAHGYPSSGDEEKWIQWAAAEMAERSNGVLKLTSYPDGTLGDEMETCAQIIAGAIDLGLSEGSAWADACAVPQLAITGLPYLYTSYEQLKSVGLGAVPEVFDTMLQDNNCGLKGFVPFSGGLRGCWTVKAPIASLNDFVGLKMRCPEIKLFSDTVAGMGANPTPVAFTELYTAVSQGVVDGFELDVATCYDNGLQEIVHYFTPTNHLGSLNIFAMNLDKWNSIPAEYQEIFATVLAEAAEQQFDEREAAIAEKTQLLVDNAGLTVTELSDADMAQLVENMQPVWQEYIDNYGVGDLIDQLANG